MNRYGEAICIILIACIAIGCSSDTSGDPVEGDVELSTWESEVIVCGTTCPGGSHPTSYTCSSSCGFCGIFNAANCQPNTGASFFQCGTTCPAGFHPTRYKCSSACGTCTIANAADCSPNTGTSFFQCGTTCPGGYHATSLSCSSSCGGCSIKNSATCYIVRPRDNPS
jgi:hypothetical protein